MCRFLVVALVLLAAAVPTMAQAPAPEMVTYQFVALSAGPGRSSRPIEGRRAVSIRLGQHRALIQKLAASGKLIAAGAVRAIDGDDRLREVLIIDAPSSAVAREWLADDPTIKARDFLVAIHPWWTQKDTLQPIRSLEPVEPTTLGILIRPTDAPQFSDDELQRLQAGHLANIERMAAEAGLVSAGPFGDEGAQRGLLIFRGTALDKAAAQIAQDPAVRAGRLAGRLYTWSTTAGLLAPPKSSSH